MYRLLVGALVAAALLSGCMVQPGHRGAGSVSVSGSVSLEVPRLPVIVVLEEEPYYQQGGYFYFYQNDRWSYSRSRSGPWVALPNGHYPREVRYKNRDKEKEDNNRGVGRGPGKDY